MVTIRKLIDAKFLLAILALSFLIRLYGLETWTQQGTLNLNFLYMNMRSPA